MANIALTNQPLEILGILRNFEYVRLLGRRDIQPVPLHRI